VALSAKRASSRLREAAASLRSIPDARLLRFVQLPLEALDRVRETSDGPQRLQSLAIRQRAAIGRERCGTTMRHVIPGPGVDIEVLRSRLLGIWTGCDRVWSATDRDRLRGVVAVGLHPDPTEHAHSRTNNERQSHAAWARHLSPSTCTGRSLSWPLGVAPQHQTSPLARTAQE